MTTMSIVTRGQPICKPHIMSVVGPRVHPECRRHLRRPPSLALWRTLLAPSRRPPMAQLHSLSLSTAQAVPLLIVDPSDLGYRVLDVEVGRQDRCQGLVRIGSWPLCGAQHCRRPGCGGRG